MRYLAVPARSLRHVLLHSVIGLVGGLIIWRGAANKDGVVAAAGVIIAVVHGIYIFAPDSLLRYTTNIYWKTFITAGALAILLLGLKHRDPVLIVAGGYAFFSKLTPYYWSGMLRSGD